MDELRFWEIVQHAHEQSDGDMDEKCELIKTLISKMSRVDARAFSNHFESMMDRAYSWPLWGAAYVIHGGCGDDTFSDFRASLISRGRLAFEGALADPESLSAEDFDEDAWFYEGYQYAVTDGVKAVVGSIVSRENPQPEVPTGQKWAENEVKGLFPKLSKKFAGIRLNPEPLGHTELRAKGKIGKGRITSKQAVNRAIWTILVPAYFVTPAILLGYIYLIRLGSVPRGGIEGFMWFLPFLVGAFVTGWLVWAVRVPRWRRWAYREVDDIGELKFLAQMSRIIYPPGHFLEKTEIASRKMREEIKALETSKQRHRNSA